MDHIYMRGFSYEQDIPVRFELSLELFSHILADLITAFNATYKRVEMGTMHYTTIHISNININ